ncbi:acetolactate synthase large subunit [Oceanibacterium hippocampi]
MNGAESLVQTLLACGVDTCFANPGTSEMHFVAALDRVAGMRCVLGLFEGVVTGAADGYSRLSGKPAATLLHLGPGLANGLANLHNARRAGSPVVNIVGEHASFHLRYDAPLTSDIEGVARPMSHWVRTSRDAASVAQDGADAVAAARAAPGQIATLILPADTAWNPARAIGRPPLVDPPRKVDDSVVAESARLLRRGAGTLLLLGGDALTEENLRAAGAIAAHSGADLMATTYMRNMARGAGRVSIPRLPYPVAQALPALAPYRTIILVGAPPPVSFFGYPESPSELHPPGCTLHRMVATGEDAGDALARLIDRLGADPSAARLQAPERPAAPRGPITPDGIAQALAAALPENAIVVDEAITTGRGFYAAMAGAAPHSWLSNLGGSIGFGPPVGTGAAVAAPDRKVFCLEGDGSFMYTPQSLWTQARENLDVTTIVFANRSYNILKHELAMVGAGNPGRNALDMLELDRPDLDIAGLARAMGVPARKATTLEELNQALENAVASSGPKLIEVML